MSHNLTSIHRACKRTTNDTQQLSVASQQLDKLANDLSEMVQKFKQQIR